MKYFGPTPKLEPKSEARVFVAALLDPKLTKEQKNRLVELWNIDHRKDKKN